MNVLAIVMMIYQLTRSSASAKRQHVTAVHATRTFPGFLAFSFSCLRITSSLLLNPPLYCYILLKIRRIHEMQICEIKTLQYCIQDFHHPCVQHNMTTVSQQL